MDCGWQNPEQEASSRSEYLKPLTSNADCTERAFPPQTSGMRGVLSLFAMISLQLTSDVLPSHSLPQLGFRCYSCGDSVVGCFEFSVWFSDDQWQKIHDRKHG